MLDKKAEKVLKCIIEKSNANFEELIEISHRDFKDKSITNNMLNAICCQLHNEGYIGSCYVSYDENDSLNLILKNEGYCYFENKRTLLFWNRFPVVISFAALLCTVVHLILDILGIT